jgi:hypothetical protein
MEGHMAHECTYLGSTRIYAPTSMLCEFIRRLPDSHLCHAQAGDLTDYQAPWSGYGFRQFRWVMCRLFLNHGAVIQA